MLDTVEETLSRQWPGEHHTRVRPDADCAGQSAAELDTPLGESASTACRYKGGNLLGEGGMGKVLGVTDPSLGRRVAMKVMHPEVASTLDGRRRFLREARIQGQLEHPAVVPVYDLGVDENGVPYFTMKQVQGLTLAVILERLAAGDAELRSRFPRRRLLTLFVQVCLAIDFAHSRAVLHRDLKPANIMVGDFGDVHVLDWGLAQVGQEGPAGDLAHALIQATRGGSVFGTPGYMAPEQIQGQVLDARADVYALGAILFELLTFTPLHGGSVSERIARTLEGGCTSACVRNSAAEVPPELDSIVSNAAQRHASSRTVSARVLAEAVERFLDGDRDLERRLTLAASHLALARPLIEQLATASTLDRENAMRELSRALAFNPGNADALGLLHQLITYVPSKLPPDVERARQSAEGHARSEVTRAVAVRTATWLALVPLIWAMGPVNTPLAMGVVLSVVGALALATWMGRQASLSNARLFVVLAATGIALLGLNRLFGSFVVVPCLAATSTVMFASHLHARARILAISMGLLVVLGPFVLEELGLIAPAYEFTADQIRVLPLLVHLPPGATKVVLVVATIASLVMPGVLAGRLRDRLAHAEKRLFLMAWHFERLGRTAA